MIFLAIVLLLILISAIPGKSTAAFNEFCRLECRGQKSACAGRCR